MKTKLLLTLTLASLSEARSFLASSRTVVAVAKPTREPANRFSGQHSRILRDPVSSSAALKSSAEDGALSGEKLKPMGIAAWFSGMSYFIWRNYKVGPFLPVTLGKQTWVFLHAVANMFFTGGIVLSTLLEWRVVSDQNPEVVYFWFTRVVSTVDTWIVLPALTISIVAGFAQTALDYGSMKSAPKHIRRAIHILATFGLWWMATDLTTQRTAKTQILQWYKKVSRNRRVKLPTKILFLRRASNLMSCLFVGTLYALMALKPWYTP